jgi:hypothetical protein
MWTGGILVAATGLILLSTSGSFNVTATVEELKPSSVVAVDAASSAIKSASGAAAELPEVADEAIAPHNTSSPASAISLAEQATLPVEPSPPAQSVASPIPLTPSYLLRSPPFVTESDAKVGFMVSEASGVEPRIVERGGRWYVEAGPFTDRKAVENVAAEIRRRTPERLQFLIEESKN